MALSAALLDANWVREPNRYNPDQGAHVGAPDPTHFPPATAPLGMARIPGFDRDA
jgi:hypothetical protein